MNYTFIKNFLRRYLRHPQIYSLARRAMLVGQWAMRRPDEPDFSVFSAMKNENGLVVDIGANGGQSAIAFSFLLPGFNILSFEPNPALWGDLGFVERIIGRRFSFKKIGLGPEAGAMTLYVPQLGALPVTTRASLDRAAAEAHCERLAKEVGQKPEISETKVDIVPFDSLDLQPAIVKIDVEGYERHVLEGMERTLQKHKPILLLESNPDDRACMELLWRFGYRFYYFDLKTRRITADPQHRTRNWFAVPQGKEGLLGI